MAAMEPLDGIIPVRSEKQAMDWSLVLVSQGLETAIERSPEDGSVFLVVAPAEREQALGVIRLYERENRRRRWQQPVRWTGLMLDWRVLFCLLPLLAIFFLDEVAGVTDLKSAGLMDSGLVRQGAWWRLFTAVTLHADAAHLASNLVSGVLLLGLAMGSGGPGKALLGSFLAGVAGNVAGLFLLAEPHRGLGASGMVLGALGLLTVHSMRLWWQGESRRRLVVRAFGAGCLLLVLLGFNPQADVVAHVGGFAGGLLFGTVVAFLPEKWASSAVVDRSAGWTCLALFLLSWGRAIWG